MEDPDFLRKYLLGELSEDKTDAVELRMLADNAYFELVEAVEEDLLADCARGVLSPEKQAWVLRRLASSPRGQERLALARGLNGLATRLSNTHPMHQAKPIPFPVHLFTPRKMGVRLAAMAAGVFVVFGGLWLSMHTVFPGGAVVAGNARNDTGAAVRHLQVPERTAQAPAAPTPAPVPPPPPRAGGEQIVQERPTVLREVAPAILELALTVFRSGDAQRPTLTVPAGTRQVEIHLPILEGDDFPAYHATVLDAVDAPVWQEDLAPPRAGSVVVVSLPAAKLPRGTYRLELRGMSPDGGAELLGTRLFDVRTL